jgi:predicted CXXCH cytochrome family protein
MKRILIITLGAFLASGLAMGQSVVGTAHDLSSTGPDVTYRSTNVDQVCIFCHTPHQATTATGQDPQWNHELDDGSTPTYGVYASTTLQATPAEVGAAAGSAGVSMLCMSCHDGSVGVGSLYKDPVAGVPDNNTAITGTALVGSSLTDDHPINFTYDGTLAGDDGGLKTPDSTNYVDALNEVPLFGGTVQCGSCHDPHVATNTPFLVVDNTASALCIKCHNK